MSALNLQSNYNTNRAMTIRDSDGANCPSYANDLMRRDAVYFGEYTPTFLKNLLQKMEKVVYSFLQKDRTYLSNYMTSHVTSA